MLRGSAAPFQTTAGIPPGSKKGVCKHHTNAEPNTPFQYIDTRALGFPRQFYRLRPLP